MTIVFLLSRLEGNPFEIPIPIIDYIKIYSNFSILVKFKGIHMKMKSTSYSRSALYIDCSNYIGKPVLLDKRRPKIHEKVTKRRP